MHALVLDNVQQYVRVFEPGIGFENKLQRGTFATVIRLEDVEPGAFDLEPYTSSLIENKRSSMTVRSINRSIDWEHIDSVMALHFLHALVDFIPQLSHLKSDVSKAFRSAPIAKHRMREGRKTWVQPLGTNAEVEIETQGMYRALIDFMQQMGIPTDAAQKHLQWIGGDGASFAAMWRVRDFLGLLAAENLKTGQNILPTTEIWHKRQTNLNTVATNHFGPAASDDPSSLSKNAGLTGMKRPTDLKSCDFYPTS